MFAAFTHDPFSPHFVQFISVIQHPKYRLRLLRKSQSIQVSSIHDNMMIFVNFKDVGSL